MKPRDVVVSGVGVISALARNAMGHVEALSRGVSALRADPLSDSGAQVARMEDPILRSAVPDALETQVRFLNRAGEAAVEAAREAVIHAGLVDSDAIGEPVEPRSRHGLFLSQVDSANWDCNEFWPSVLKAPGYADGKVSQTAYNRAASRHVKPYFILEDLKNNAFSFIATWFGLGGANSSATGYAGPAMALLQAAARSIRVDELDVALVVAAANPIGDIARAEFRTRLVRPTWSPGEGAAAIVLESSASAASRGVHPLASMGPYRHRRREGLWNELMDGVDADAWLVARSEAESIDAQDVVAWDTAWGDMTMAADLATLALGARSLEAREGTLSLGVLTAGLRGEKHLQVLRSTIASEGVS